MKYSVFQVNDAGSGEPKAIFFFIVRGILSTYLPDYKNKNKKTLF